MQLNLLHTAKTTLDRSFTGAVHEPESLCRLCCIQFTTKKVL